MKKIGFSFTVFSVLLFALLFYFGYHGQLYGGKAFLTLIIAIGGFVGGVTILINEFFIRTK